MIPSTRQLERRLRKSVREWLPPQASSWRAVMWRVLGAPVFAYPWAMHTVWSSLIIFSAVQLLPDPSLSPLGCLVAVSIVQCVATGLALASLLGRLGAAPSIFIRTLPISDRDLFRTLFTRWGRDTLWHAADFLVLYAWGLRGTVYSEFPLWSLALLALAQAVLMRGIVLCLTFAIPACQKLLPGSLLILMLTSPFILSSERLVTVAALQFTPAGWLNVRWFQAWPPSNLLLVGLCSAALLGLVLASFAVRRMFSLFCSNSLPNPQERRVNRRIGWKQSNPEPTTPQRARLLLRERLSSPANCRTDPIRWILRAVLPARQRVLLEVGAMDGTNLSSDIAAGTLVAALLWALGDAIVRAVSNGAGAYLSQPALMAAILGPMFGFGMVLFFLGRGLMSNRISLWAVSQPATLEECAYFSIKRTTLHLLACAPAVLLVQFNPWCVCLQRAAEIGGHCMLLKLTFILWLVAVLLWSVPTICELVAWRYWLTWGEYLLVYFVAYASGICLLAPWSGRAGSVAIPLLAAASLFWLRFCFRRYNTHRFFAFPPLFRTHP